MGWIIIADVCFEWDIFLRDPMQFWSVTAGSFQGNEPQFQTKLSLTCKEYISGIFVTAKYPPLCILLILFHSVLIPESNHADMAS